MYFVLSALGDVFQRMKNDDHDHVPIRGIGTRFHSVGKMCWQIIKRRVLEVEGLENGNVQLKHEVVREYFKTDVKYDSLWKEME